MRKELDYFYIDGAYGGVQDWFSDYWMKLGGCAAVTACDCSIYFSLFSNKKLYPFDQKNISKKDYINFSKIMKPYLRPRISGIDRLSIYLEGFRKYLVDKGEESLKLDPWSGENRLETTKNVIKHQLENNFPIPYLLLKHRDKEFDDYTWHWFLITGYEELEDSFLVKVVTYGSACWLNFDKLWDTQYSKKGGFIIFRDGMKE